ncbi:hypothetical protein GCM10022419_093480 [Nonomuraea rosea]|uniref:Uncharacterized protein n=1 Tax=Nonomuraea rosea TaxID=638574 RepID=A0ABP6Z4Q5_9ACTN
MLIYNVKAVAVVRHVMSDGDGPAARRHPVRKHEDLDAVLAPGIINGQGIATAKKVMADYGGQAPCPSAWRR